MLEMPGDERVVASPHGMPFVHVSQENSSLTFLEVVKVLGKLTALRQSLAPGESEVGYDHTYRILVAPQRCVDRAARFDIAIRKIDASD